MITGHQNYNSDVTKLQGILSGVNKHTLIDAIIEMYPEDVNIKIWMRMAQNMKDGLKEYLEKSKDTKEDLENKEDSLKLLLHFDNYEGWMEYIVYDDIFWIQLLKWDKKATSKATYKTWNFIKKFAKECKCSKIQFTTKRDGKLWERRFKDMKIKQYKLEVIL